MARFDFTITWRCAVIRFKDYGAVSCRARFLNWPVSGLSDSEGFYDCNGSKVTIGWRVGVKAEG